MSKERLEEIKKTQYQIIELSKTNMQEDFKYLLSYIDNLEMAFDDLDSDYIDLQEQNKELLEGLAAIGNAIHEGEISGRGTDENLILEIVVKHWRNRDE